MEDLRLGVLRESIDDAFERRFVSDHARAVVDRRMILEQRDRRIDVAAVAIAPVTDLSLLKEQAEGFTNRRIAQQFIGSGSHITAGSPVRRAGSITAPVLLVHGDLDANVDIKHSEEMLSALQGSGKKVELLRFKGLDHQLNDSNARAQMLTRIGQFLDGAIGH